MGLARFDQSPTVRIAEGTPDRERAWVHYAIALINRELPYDQRVQLGDDAPALTALDDVPAGQIFIEYAPRGDWNTPSEPGPTVLGLAELERWVNGGLRAGIIWLDTERSESDFVQVSILLHEVLHALGISSHVPRSEFPDSLMSDHAQLTSDRVPEIDAAALLAIYNRYDNNTLPEDVSVTSLGPWETTSMNLTADLGRGAGRTLLRRPAPQRCERSLGERRPIAYRACEQSLAHGNRALGRRVAGTDSRNPIGCWKCDAQYRRQHARGARGLHRSPVVACGPGTR